jgi:hypothetical protein
MAGWLDGWMVGWLDDWMFVLRSGAVCGGLGFWETIANNRQQLQTVPDL